MKKCTKCKKVKEEEKFSKNRSTRDGLHGWCKVCRKVPRAAYYEKNKEKKKWREILKTYGLTQEAYCDMLEAQGGGCLSAVGQRKKQAAHTTSTTTTTQERSEESCAATATEGLGVFAMILKAYPMQ